MNGRKKRTLLLYALWGVGLSLLALPAVAQGLFPSLGDAPDIKSWAVMFLVGAMFTVIMIVAQRWMKAMDKLADGVQRLSLEAAKTREWKKGIEKEQCISKKRANVHSDKIAKIIHSMAKCAQCPEVEV